MKVILSSRDLQEAPAEVLRWILGRVSPPVQSPPVQSPPVQSPPVQSPPVQSAPVQSAPVQSAPVSLETVIKAATDIAARVGTAGLQSVLTSMGVSRVSECPPERLAELLAKLSALGEVPP